MFSKYQQNCDDVTCIFNIENRNRCSQYRKNKQLSGKFSDTRQNAIRVSEYNKCVRLPDSGGGSWIVIPSLPS